MIQAALNGGRSRRFHSAVPCSPAEIAREAAAAVAAGAGSLHIHPRDREDRESLDPDVIASALEAVRQAVPGTPVGVSTGAWIPPGGAARHDAIRAWTVLPDYVSVNLMEPDSAAVIALALQRGIGVEAGVWSPGDVDLLAAHPDAGRCLRLLVEINEQDVGEALAAFRATLARADHHGLTLPVLAHGMDAGFWPVHAAAMALGLDTRAGLEDCVFLPNGALARDNADAIAAALAFRHDRET